MTDLIENITGRKKTYLEVSVDQWTLLVRNYIHVYI